MSEKILLGSEFAAGIEYEGIRESINNEMARHNSLAYRLGVETAEGRLHLEAMDALEEVRRYLEPDDVEALRLVSLMLKGSQADHPAGEAA